MALHLSFVSSADGVRIPVQTQGDGPFLVYVRGWITNLEYVDADPAIEDFFAPLRAHRRVVRYDTRGNGLADRALPRPPTLDDVVADLEAVIDSLPTDDPVELWGSSFGAPIALAYAARHPEQVDKLVLDGAYASGAELIPPAEAEKFLAMLGMAEHQPDTVFSSLSFLTDPDPRITHEVRVQRLKRSIDPAALVALYGLSFSVDVRHLLADVTAETLVLHRAESRAVHPQNGWRLAAQLPHATFVSLPGRAHNLWEGDTATARQQIAAFLGFTVGAEATSTGADAPGPDGTAGTNRDRDPVAGRAEVDPEPVAESITVMFTDICGSTALTARLGDDGAQHLVRAHNDIVRRALARYQGREVKHTGDGIMASFRSASAAVVAAATIQRAVIDARESGAFPDLALKIGLNAGEPISEDEDLFGAVVQVAARACDAAAPDQILVTPVVRALATGKGLVFADAGERDFKGVAEPVPLWSVPPAEPEPEITP